MTVISTVLRDLFYKIKRTRDPFVHREVKLFATHSQHIFRTRSLVALMPCRLKFNGLEQTQKLRKTNLGVLFVYYFLLLSAQGISPGCFHLIYLSLALYKLYLLAITPTLTEILGTINLPAFEFTHIRP